MGTTTCGASTCARAGRCSGTCCSQCGDGGAAPRTVGRVHWYHGTRARRPERFLTDGILPLPLHHRGGWEELVEFAPEIPLADIVALREDLAAGRVEPYTYAQRIDRSAEHGPYGQLVRSAFFDHEAYAAVDYLSGAEIVVDACIAARERFGIDVEARMRAATTMCIVEFALPSRDTENEFAAACWYVEAALRGATTHDAKCFHDGKGMPVPPSAVTPSAPRTRASASGAAPAPNRPHPGRPRDAAAGTHAPSAPRRR